MIISPDLTLRPLEEKDLEQCREWVNNPVIAEPLLRYLPVSDWEHRDWYKAGNGRVYFAIDADRYIGNIGIKDIDWKNRNGYLFVFIGIPKYWNQGYATSAVDLFLKYCFETLNLHKINLRVLEEHEGAIKVYEKCGFIKEGLLREEVYFGGKYHNLLIMGKINENIN